MNLLSSISRGIRGFFKGNRFEYSILRQVGYKGEVWINTDVPYDVFNSIPQAKIVINKLADIFSNGDAIIETQKGGYWEKVDNHTAYATIHQPNFKQGQNDFYKDLARKFHTYGNNFEYFNRPSIVGGVVSRWNISPRYIKPVLTGKVFDQTEMSGAVEKYIYDDDMAIRKDYDVKDILWLAESDLDNPLMGFSKLASLKYPLSNIKGAYSYRNAIINNKGMLGFIVNKSVESGGTKPMSQEDKDNLNRQYSQDYGHGDGQIPFAVLNGDADFKTTSYPTKELLLFEEVDANLVTIAQMYGMNPNLFLTETTYENLKNGIIQTYQDSIIPFADMVAQNETKMYQSLGQMKPNERIRFSFDHIELLQESKLNGFQTLERAINAMNNALLNGIVTQQQATEVINNLITRVN